MLPLQNLTPHLGAPLDAAQSRSDRRGLRSAKVIDAETTPSRDTGGPGASTRKRRDFERRPNPLPEYLDSDEMNALVRAALNSRVALLLLVQWRAGFRVSEALELEVHDLSLV